MATFLRSSVVARSTASAFARSASSPFLQTQGSDRCISIAFHQVAALASTGIQSSSFCSAAIPSHFPHGDADLDNLFANDRPMLLSIGAQWSAKSREVARRITEWGSSANDANGGVILAFADIENAPRLVEERHIRVVPTLLLLRNGKTERRADGGDTNAVERILLAAEAYNGNPVSTISSDSCLAVATADELLHRNASVDGMDGEQVWLLAESSYRNALETGGDDSAFAFRARLGLLRCALLQAEATVASEGPQPVPEAITKAADLLAELLEKHRTEVEVNERTDAESLSCFLAHAQLLLDAWQQKCSCEEEQFVLNHYAAGQKEEALDEALVWYQHEALINMEGLVEEYCLPVRRLPDREGELPSTSIYASEDLAHDRGELPAPIVPRALLRRLFAALGPRNEHVARARAKLEFLLDRKRWVPFHTRHLVTRPGGRPHGGRGTGSGDGYSRRYWIAYGPERAYKNTKPMGGPHTNSYEGW